jgi:hypothetical protein
MVDKSLACPYTLYGRDGKHLDLVSVSSISQTLVQLSVPGKSPVFICQAPFSLAP